MDAIDLTIEVECLKGELAMKKAEAAYLRAAFEEFVDKVDNALLLDEQLADAWDDLCTGVVKARRVLDGDRVKNKSGAW